VTEWLATDGLRTKLSADAALRHRVLAANAMDYVLYTAAQQHFEAAYHAMLMLAAS
jgi:hypothetical protein